METVAVYWEPRIKTFGFNTASDLILFEFFIEPKAMVEWGFKILKLDSFTGDFCLVTAQYFSQSGFKVYILVQNQKKGEAIGMPGPALLLENLQPVRVTSPVELLCFQGPHFGDRYGVAHTAFKALDEKRIPVIMSGCSGSSIYIVLAERNAGKAKELLSEVFEVPKSSKITC